MDAGFYIFNYVETYSLLLYADISEFVNKGIWKPTFPYYILSSSRDDNVTGLTPRYFLAFQHKLDVSETSHPVQDVGFPTLAFDRQDISAHSSPDALGNFTYLWKEDDLKYYRGHAYFNFTIPLPYEAFSRLLGNSVKPVIITVAVTITFPDNDAGGHIDKDQVGPSDLAFTVDFTQIATNFVVKSLVANYNFPTRVVTYYLTATALTLLTKILPNLYCKVNVKFPLFDNHGTPLPYASPLERNASVTLSINTTENLQVSLDYIPPVHRSMWAQSSVCSDTDTEELTASSFSDLGCGEGLTLDP